MSWNSISEIAPEGMQRKSRYLNLEEGMGVTILLLRYLVSP